MPFHDINIARESVQVKEKNRKGRAGPPPLCACQGVPSAGSGNGMPVYPDRDSPMAGTSPWPWHRSGAGPV
ncbi:MAG: hypothetical protein OXC57_11035 [Rhodobacteraceae bacterium]|nr:hypothetical protein [Paracoccaceae bacterium]